MARIGTWGKVELYILSLWILFLLVIFVTADIPVCFGDDCTFIGWINLIYRNIIPIISIFALVSGCIIYMRLNYRISGSKNLSVKIVELEDINYEHLTFLATYIVPLIGFNFTSTRYVLVVALLLVVIGIIYVKTDKYYANPTLALLGFRLYKVTIKLDKDRTNTITVITRRRLEKNSHIRTIMLDEKFGFAGEAQ